ERPAVRSSSVAMSVLVMTFPRLGSLFFRPWPEGRAVRRQELLSAANLAEITAKSAGRGKSATPAEWLEFFRRPSYIPPGGRADTWKSLSPRVAPRPPRPAP